MLSFTLGFIALALPFLARAQTYSATYVPSDAPNQSEQGQTGTNQCGSGSNQTSNCQNVYINSIDDWCIFAPPEPGPDSVIGNTERIEVSWCIKPGYGTRLIPDGAITGAHFVQTPDYVQVTGVGNLTLVNIPDQDEGGELDPHGADGNGNPIGGLVFSSAFTGQFEQLHEWTNFVAFDEFCIRGCKDSPQAPALCNHIYDVMGCAWNMPANYAPGVFERCLADDALPMGVYGSSTFFQGQPSTPSAHPIPSSSSCTTLSSIGNLAVSTSSPITSASSTSVSAPSSSASSAVTSAGTSSQSTAVNTGSVSETSSEPTPGNSTAVANPSKGASLNSSTPVPTTGLGSATGSASGSSGSATSGASRTSSSSTNSASASTTSGASSAAVLFNAQATWANMLVALGLVAGALAVF